MASSCIPTGLRLPDMEMVKPAVAAAPGAAPMRPASHSTASSTLSEASNSSSTSSLSLKRARTPRKRPNQTYNEAAALLASMYPSVFPAAGHAPPRLLGLASALADDASCADLLPPFPVLGNAACLLRDSPSPTPPRSPVLSKACLSPAAVSSAFFTEFRDSAPSPGTPEGAAAADEPGELDFDDDDDGFDADSFLLGGVDEGAAAEGIDGIMGRLSVESGAVSGVNRVLSSSGLDPYIRSLMVLGLGFQRSRPNIKQALKRHDDDSEWWMCPAIPLKDITPALPPLMAPPPLVEKKKKKTKKKALKDIVVGPCKKCEEDIPDAVYGDDGILALKLPKTGLGLSLNTEEVLKAWYDRGSVFADGNIPDSSSTDGLVRISSFLR